MMPGERLWKGALAYKLLWDGVFFLSIVVACTGLHYWLVVDMLYFVEFNSGSQIHMAAGELQAFSNVTVWSPQFWSYLWDGSVREEVRNLLLMNNRGNLLLLFFLFLVLGMAAFFLRLYQAGYVTKWGIWEEKGDSRRFVVHKTPVWGDEPEEWISKRPTWVRKVFFAPASWDTIQNDLFLVILFWMLGLFFVLAVHVNINSLPRMVLYFLLLGSSALFMGTALVRRIRIGAFWKHCLLYQVGCALSRGLRLFWQGLWMRRRVAVGLVLFFLPFYQICRLLGLLWIWWCVGLFLLVVLLRDFFLIAQILEDFSGEEIQAQQLEVVVRKLIFPYSRAVLRRLYKMKGRIEEAVLEQTRADRQRNELITNVTHDLRTPLTSILNAVDLLRSGALDEAERVEQFEILADRAQRLQGLQTDLLEISKAATGELPIQWVELDLHLFLLQMAGDWQSDFEKARLQLVYRVQDLMGEQRRYLFGSHAEMEFGSCTASDSALSLSLDSGMSSSFAADSQSGSDFSAGDSSHVSTEAMQVPLSPFGVTCDPDLMQRVFENLFANACRYSLSDSRVYLILEMKGGIHRIRVRNYARDPLKHSGAELLERFIREEEARSDTGSGLGLAIAKSLVELMHGSLQLEVQEDLFEVQLELPQSDLAPEDWTAGCAV